MLLKTVCFLDGLIVTTHEEGALKNEGLVEYADLQQLKDIGKKPRL